MQLLDRIETGINDLEGFLALQTLAGEFAVEAERTYGLPTYGDQALSSRPSAEHSNFQRNVARLDYFSTGLEDDYI